MFSRCGFQVLFFFVIISIGTCQAATVNLGDGCSSGDTCGAGTICDAGHCKYKNGTDCTANEQQCVDGATCTDTVTPKVCVCGPGRTPATTDGICAAAIKVAVGGACRTTNDCDTGLVCENSLCKYKNGSECTAHDQECVDGATCTGTAPPKVCVCGTGRTPATPEGKCAAASTPGAKVAVGGACPAANDCDTGLVCENSICKSKNGSVCTTNDQCVDGANCTGTASPKVCVCGTGRTPASTEGKCAAASTPGGTKVAVGGVCTATNSCDTGLVCENSRCKIKNGTDCTAHDQECVDGANCTGTSKVCVCGPGRTPATTEGKCAAASTPGAKVAVGGACTAANSCDTGMVCENSICKYKNGTDCTANEQQCVDGATCTGTASPKVCVCGTGRTPATTEGKCAAKNGAPSLLASLLFVVGLMVTSRLL